MAQESFGIAQTFRDRTDAGQALAGLLRQYRDRSDVLVLGLPRGGVPVAYEVAKAIDAELDVLIVRKISALIYPELALGAIADGGSVYVNTELLREVNISKQAFNERLADAEHELLEHQRVYRGKRQSPEIKGRAVIAIDDGIATGASMKVALQAIRAQKPLELVCAVPVAPTGAAKRLGALADHFFCVLSAPDFRSVGEFYENFNQVSTDEVCRLLEKARAERARAHRL